MLAPVRQASILEALRRSGSVTVAQIAGQLAVSEMTIRRDLVNLERGGRLTRKHGGAVTSQRVAMDRDEPAFEARLALQLDAKTAIAVAAAALVEDVRTAALDVGATTFLLAAQLRKRAGLKLFTNSLRVAAALAEGPQEVYVPGGRVRGADMVIGGPSAVEQFDKLWFDIAFVGVSGITGEGLFDYSFEDTELKRVYLRRASRKVVLCDSSKFQHMSLVHIAGYDAVDLVITDAVPPPEIAAALERAGAKLQIAPPAPGSNTRF